MTRKAEEPPPLRIPITGELDLHTFQPAEAGSLVAEYLAACQAQGLREVRLIHGKGTGTLRATVHAVLRRSLLVESIRQGDETSGGWGATLVTLKANLPPR
jgi:DNA-nicking Smr family endonuclease